MLEFECLIHWWGEQILGKRRQRTASDESPLIFGEPMRAYCEPSVE